MILNNPWILSFIIYMILPAITLYGSKVVPNNELSNFFLKKNNYQVFKGFFSILIIVVHFSQYIEYGKGVLNPFQAVGYLCVSYFLFMSGYGMSVSYQQNINYLNKFFLKKIIPIYVPFIIIGFITGVTSNVLLNTSYSVKRIILNSIFINSHNGEADFWYIKAMLCFYCIFYITFKYAQSYKQLISLNFLFISLYIIILFMMDYELFWMKSALSFPIGIFCAFNQNEIIKFLNKKRWLKLLAIVPLFVISFISEIFLTNKFWTLLIQLIASTSFIYIMIFITSYITFNSKFMKIIGKYSLEMYIAHIPLIYILSKNTYEFGFLAFSSVLVGSFIISVLTRFLYSSLFKIKNNKNIALQFKK